MKVKIFSGTKKCSIGDKYKFRNGIAKVEDMWISKKPVYISIAEFIEINSNIGKSIEA